LGQDKLHSAPCRQQYEANVSASAWTATPATT
jgi:hypothetical protein